MTRPVRVPTAGSEIDQLKRRVYDLERALNSRTSDTRSGVTDSSIVTINVQSGTSYTLARGDAGALVKMTSGSANTVTVPPNSTAAFTIGSTLEIVQWGAGATTLVAGSGVTIRSPNGSLALAAQYGGVTLTKMATNEWWLEGDLS